MSAANHLAHTEPAAPVRQQRTLRLTPHPLQRVGAFALAELAGAGSVDEVSPEAFDDAIESMARDAVHASRAASTNAEDGFWLKASGSFFPNAPMNHHPTRKKQSPAEIEARVRAWRRMPDSAEWPGEPCALCARPSCGFYGKKDVPLAPSAGERNTTPQGHEGLALCWACVCSFYALPYGCLLTGGPSSALHSWDECFLDRTTARRVVGNKQHVALGRPARKTGMSAELTALRQLRYHDDRLVAGVDLMVFSNDNREAFLVTHSLEQPLAEWLRRTVRPGSRGRGFTALLRAHRTQQRSGSAELAYNAFHRPRRILSAAVTHLVERTDGHGLLSSEISDLTELCFSYATEVMGMDDKDVEQIRILGANVATVLAASGETGPLKKYQVAHRKPADLKHWFKRNAVAWLLRVPAADDGSRQPYELPPLITDRQWRLLFDIDGQGRDYRDLLFISVLESLHERGWRPESSQEATELAAEQEYAPEDEALAEQEVDER